MLKNNGSRAVDIIGGADGPTSVYLIKQTGRKPLKHHVKNLIYKFKGKRAEKRIVPGAHTLTELVEYATNRYAAVELDKNHKRYIMQQGCMKESLILRFRPELLGEWKDIPFVATENEEEMKYWCQQWNRRSEYISNLPDDIFPMDFHIYEIVIKDGRVELDIDYIWNEFQISYSGKKKSAMKKVKKTAQDLAYTMASQRMISETERKGTYLCSHALVTERVGCRMKTREGVNPYEALTEYEILEKLEKSRAHAAQGMYKDADEVLHDMKEKYGI